MGSKSRGQGALTEAEKAGLAAGEIGQDGESLDLELEAGDVLMEVLAEDFRHRRTVEFAEGDVLAPATAEREASDDAQEPQAALPPPRGPRLAQRQYLTHPGVGVGNQFQRQQAAARQRLENAEAHARNHEVFAKLHAAIKTSGVDALAN